MGASPTAGGQAMRLPRLRGVSQCGRSDGAGRVRRRYCQSSAWGAWRVCRALEFNQRVRELRVFDVTPYGEIVARSLTGSRQRRSAIFPVNTNMDAAPLVQGDTIGIDAMTLEACEAWLTRLAEASGITAPTRTERARFSKAQEEGVQ